MLIVRGTSPKSDPTTLEPIYATRPSFSCPTVRRPSRSPCHRNHHVYRPALPRSLGDYSPESVLSTGGMSHLPYERSVRLSTVSAPPQRRYPAVSAVLLQNGPIIAACTTCSAATLARTHHPTPRVPTDSLRVAHRACPKHIRLGNAGRERSHRLSGHPGILMCPHSGSFLCGVSAGL